MVANFFPSRTIYISRLNFYFSYTTGREKTLIIYRKQGKVRLPKRSRGGFHIDYLYD